MTILKSLKKRQETLSHLYSPVNTEVYTPVKLVKEMLDKLPKKVWSNPELKFCDPAIKSGVFLSEVMIRLMKGLEKFEQNENKRYIYIVENMIYGYTTSDLSYRVVKKLLLLENSKMMHSIFNYNFLEEKNNMKFDVMAQNPPFQTQNDGENITHPIWDKFVAKSFEYLKKGGYIVNVHPSGYRDVYGRFNYIKELLLSKDIKYLEMHDDYDGVKMFGVQTTYDWYVVKNIETHDNKTEIKLQNGDIKKVDLNKLQFVPNGMFLEIEKLIAKNNEKKCKVISDCSYHHTLAHMNKEKTKEFKYPCVYTTEKNGTINCWYSNTNRKGHFGIPKLFWSNGSASTLHIDIDGKYGLTQFAYAIVDTEKNLKNIKNAMQTKKFIEIMKNCSMGKRDIYFYKVISLFKKDFWKYFVDKKGKEI